MTTAQSNNVTHFCNPLNFVTQNAFAIAASNNWKIATMYHNKEYTRVTMFTPFYFVHPTTKQRMEALLKQFSTVVGISLGFEWTQVDTPDNRCTKLTITVM